MIFNMTGGGQPLNFKVVGGKTQPTSPPENTIWVNTDVNIASWHFNSEMPKNMMHGDVWIFSGVSSSVEFNALKKNSIQIYPISAKQYVSGALVSVEAKIYQNGMWKDWWNGYLYNSGDSYEQITGGWEASAYSYVDLNNSNYAESPTVVDNGNTITLKRGKQYWDDSYGSNRRGVGVYHTRNKISLHGKTSLTLNITEMQNPGKSNIAFLVVSENLETSFIPLAYTNTTTAGKFSLDVSNINTNAYISVGIGPNNTNYDVSFTFDEVKLS